MGYAYCVSKDCSYYSYFTREEKPEKFCSNCGKPLISSCPNCKAVREKMEAKFCPECGNPYK
jgi:rRNA maturation endonuclease Nob1